MKGFSERDYAKLIKMLSDIESLIHEFYSLTCKQTEILDFGDVNLLEKNIEDRQGAIERIDRIQHEVNHLLETYKHLSVKSDANDPKVKQIASAQDRIKNRLIETQLLNEENEKMGYRKMEELKLKGKRLHMSRKNIRIYNQDLLTTEPIYYDKKE